MQIELLQENLIRATNAAVRFVSPRAQMPVLGNVLLEAKEGRLRLSATNLEMGIVMDVAAKVGRDGAITVPARVFSETVSGISKEVLVLEADKTTLTLSGGRSKSVINGIAAEEFPRLPLGPEEQDVLFGRETLKEITQRVAFAAATDEGRPALTGILVLLNKEGAQFVATDGFRLSVESVGSVKSESEKTYIIPARALIEASRILQEQAVEKIGLSLLPEGNQAQFVFEFGALTTRIIDGNFPPYAKIIPISHKTRTVVDKEEFISAVRLASVIARDSANIVRLRLQKERVGVFANAPQVGKNENEVVAKTSGEEVEIAFNSRYLLEFLASQGGESVSIESAGPLSPTIFQDPQKKQSLHIIMPVRVAP